MKMRLLVATSILLMSVATTASSAEPEAKSSSDPQNPVAVITEKEFTFEPVVDGSEVAHGYLIKNTGKGILEISRVKTG